MDLEVKESRNGKSIYTTHSYAADAVLFEVTGVFISGDEDENIDDAVRDNAFRFSEDVYISPQGSIGDYQNHSCEPNAKVLKKDERLYVVALMPMLTGDEVLIDYSTIIGADDVWEMECNCGSAVCRGVVQSYDLLPRALQKKYEKAGMVPDYIRES